MSDLSINCYSSEAVSSFLRYSRKISDDQVATEIYRYSGCGEYISTVLFPEWYSRDKVLKLCEDKLEKDLTDSNNSGDVAGPLPTDANSDNKKERPSGRLDPYGERDYGKKAIKTQDVLLDNLKREVSIESIIRSATAEVLAEKCSEARFSKGPDEFLLAYRGAVANRESRQQKSQ